MRSYHSLTVYLPKYVFHDTEKINSSLIWVIEKEKPKTKMGKEIHLRLSIVWTFQISDI